MCGVTPAQNEIDPPDGCDFSLGITYEGAPPDKVSEKAKLDSILVPPRGCTQLGLGGVPGQPPRGQISKEKSCPPSMQGGAHSSECREVDMGAEFEMFPPTKPHGLFTGPLGHTPNLDNSPALDSVGAQGSASYFLSNG